MRINEENFIMHLLNKNEKALDYLIDVYGGLIKSIVNKHLYSLNDYKDECVNDILLAVWNGVDKYDESKGDFKNWLAAVCKYKCIYYKRKYLNISIIEENIDSIEVKAEDNIEKKMKREELKNEIESLLSALKPRDRDIFISYYINEEKIQDIARNNSVKEEVIYNRISRGKKKIKAIFGSR
ncbi:MAG: sigma-70 family RNA polymerase sigma factor [Clostridium sp.]|uniref:sigma-70 family RNA polymerase sigma factor n=1 Tax=Clostridium sp. TaxID=1506 RepID=UPI001EC55931|nr:sigma-70 family RNA polymerase sigma factor [Clostridium sp.]MBS5883828.1 sigma-70 family RNA polymerase sigma factor [Clostridium sp.]MDU7147431.1 sigma-70 family RNA polymerase sigma factor [Clostridium sp.]